MEKEKNKPRKLTDAEIEDILNVVPKIKSCLDTVSEYNTESMKNMLREQLEDLIITPLGIEDLKSEIRRQYEHTVIKPGTVVGVTSGEALGKPITQMTLNSFQTSGSSKSVTTGVERIQELIYATHNPKKTSCSIYFKNNTLSFDNVIEDMRPKLTQITVKDLVIGIPDIEAKDEFEEPWWYTNYRLLIRDDFQSKEVLRLQVDPNLLFAYKLTIKDVCRVIEKDQAVICVFSPMDIGRIDIYPIEKQINSKLHGLNIVSSENASLIFLTMVVVPALDKLKISGIADIQQIYPVEAPVWQIVKEEILVPLADRLSVKRPEEANRIGNHENPQYYLILNTIRMKMTGIGVDKLVKLCNFVGMNVLKQRSNYIVIEMPNELDKPGELINRLQKEDKENERAYEKRKREEGARVFRRPPSQFSILANLVYAESTGSNLKALLSHPDIDSTRTYCNNVHEIQKCFGIEAARSFFIREFIDVLGTGGDGYINPRHIVLLVDFMCALGKFHGITFTGISRQPIGALEKASFERAMDIFTEASGFGETKPVIGASASIYVGKRALLGTGFSPNYLSQENLRKYEDFKKQMNEAGDKLVSSDIQIDVNNFNDAIDSLTDLEFGGDIAIIKGSEQTEAEMFGGLFSGVESQAAIAGNKVSQISTSKISTSPMKQTSEKERERISTGMVGVTVRGKPVRSQELEIAAEKLNTGITCAPASISAKGGDKYIIPEELREVQRLSTTSVRELPPLPSLPVVFPSALRPPAPTGGKRPQAQIKFNLEEFLG